MKRKRYENLDANMQVQSFRELVRWRKERATKKKDLSFQVSVVQQPEISFLQQNRTQSTLTWIGHSTFLIQTNGKNILTDPVWASRLGTDKRLTAPGIPLDSLPSIDYVLISHSHYDHLHYSSVKRLKGNPTFLVPVGLKSWFERKGLTPVIELAWWENHSFESLTYTFVPAQHWTKRTLTDTNLSHWGGWVLESENHCIYFVGDSGYFKWFQEIGKRFSIDYCLMPIGAYEPEWFMENQHVNPEKAVQAFIDTNATQMIPMHYGAYRLADDTPKEALERLKDEWKKQKLDEQHLHTLKIGETIRLEQ